MTLTLNKLGDIATSGILGGTPAAAHSVIFMANQTGRHLMSMHEWGFAEGAQTYLPFRKSIPAQAASGTTLSGTYSEATKRLQAAAGTFTDYDWKSGDLVRVFAADGVPGGLYEIAAKFSNDTVELATSPLDPAAASATLDFHIDLAWAELPADFGESIAVSVHDSLSSTFQWTSLKHIAELRSNSEGDSRAYRGALNYAVPTVTAQPVPRIEIYPSPTLNDVKALRMFYRHAWLDLDDDDSIIRIPPFLEVLFVELFRCFLLGYEEHDIAGTDARLAQVKLGDTFRAAKSADGRRQGTLGKMTGTHTRNRGYGSTYSRSSIDSPSS